MSRGGSISRASGPSSPAAARGAWPARVGTVLLAALGGFLLLKRRPLLAGLWLPPFAVLSEGDDETSAAGALAHEAGFSGTLSAAPAVRHAITHRNIRVLPFVATLSGHRVAEARPGWSWQRPGALALPTSSLLGKLAGACRQGRSQRAVDPEE